MFLHLSVILFTGRRVSVQTGGLCSGGSLSGGLCQGDPPYGTHSTGMHSCFRCKNQTGIAL